MATASHGIAMATGSMAAARQAIVIASPTLAIGPVAIAHGHHGVEVGS